MVFIPTFIVFTEKYLSWFQKKDFSYKIIPSKIPICGFTLISRILTIHLNSPTLLNMEKDIAQDLESTYEF